MARKLVNGAEDADPCAAVDEGGLEDPPVARHGLLVGVVFEGGEEGEVVDGHECLVDVLRVVERQAHCRWAVVGEDALGPLGRPKVDDGREVVLAGHGVAVGVGVHQGFGNLGEEGKVSVQLLAAAVLKDRGGVGWDVPDALDKGRVGLMALDERLDVLAQPGGSSIHVGVHCVEERRFNGSRTPIPGQGGLDGESLGGGCCATRPSMVNRGRRGGRGAVDLGVEWHVQE